MFFVTLECNCDLRGHLMKSVSFWGLLDCICIRNGIEQSSSHFGVDGRNPFVPEEGWNQTFAFKHGRFKSEEASDTTSRSHQFSLDWESACRIMGGRIPTWLSTFPFTVLFVLAAIQLQDVLVIYVTLTGALSAQIVGQTLFLVFLWCCFGGEIGI